MCSAHPKYATVKRCVVKSEFVVFCFVKSQKSENLYFKRFLL